MKTQIRWWMLAYTIFFACLPGTRHDFSNWSLTIFTVWDWICDFLMSAGNLLYSLDRVPSAIRRPWKIVFPVLVLEFFANGIYYSLYGKHAHDGHSASLDVIVWVGGILLYFPTFRAHYLIAYGKKADVDVVA
jgi:hypothetical protein